jgi:hypothetical protein
MVDIAHKNLSGGDLHEPKGITAAPANSAYVADGLGSGLWTPTSNFPGAFGTKLFHVRDERSSGTDSGQSLTNNAWTTRTLNVTKTNQLSLTLASNQFTLPAGTWYAEGWAVHYINEDYGAGGSVNGVLRTRLRNVTDASTLIVGATWQVSGDFGVGGGILETIILPFEGVFPLAAPKVVQFQSFRRNDGSITSVNAGKAGNTGEVEVYADLRLWKIA